MKNIKLYLLLGLFAINFFIWYAVFAQEKNVLTVAFLDVGQGDAIFINTPSNYQILIDGGANKSVLRQLSKVMPFYDRSIDVVIATHPDKDHIGGLLDVLQRYEVGMILETENKSNTNIYKEFEKMISKKEVEKIIARRGMILDLYDGVFLKILFPDRNASGFESNTASIIAQLVYGEIEFMLTGDSPKTIEEYLVLVDGKELESDVLKAGHHGSKTSTATAFIGFVSPQYAIISAGRDNRYGHPHQEVLDILDGFGIPIISTYEKGMIVFESDGENVVVK